MKRQAMTVTPKQLRDLANDLEKQSKELNLELGIKSNVEHTLFQINIINKTPEQCDTWEIE